MHNFLIWYIPLAAKDFYLIVNIMDIVLSVFFPWLFYKFFYYSSSWSRDTHATINVIFAVVAIIGLIFYFTERTYRHLVHKIYMIVRLFVTVVAFVMIVLFLLDLLLGKVHNSAEYVLPAIGWGCFYILNLYWSLELLKIVN